MTGLSLILLPVALATLSLALGAWGAAKHRAAGETQILVRRLKADLEKKTRDLAYFEERNKTLATDRTRIEAERDRYRAIATTRELPTFDQMPAPVRVLDPIWVNRTYANHPRINLQRLAIDLEEYANENVVLSIRLDPYGG